MSRPLRIEYKDAWYHVMDRGANWQVIFKSDKHRELFLGLLDEINILFEVKIHAYCLMSNYYHLLIQTPLANLTRALRNLYGVYTPRFNRLENRDGPLFRGRYKSILVEADSYLLQVSRYIYHNPLEAKLCNSAEEYFWSSYGAYVGKTKSPPCLETNLLLSQMGGLKPRFQYAAFVAQGNEQELRDFYAKSYISPILGSAEFKEDVVKKVLKTSPTSAIKADIKCAQSPVEILKIIEMTAKYYKVPLKTLSETKPGVRNTARTVAIYLASRVGHYSYKKIAVIFKKISPVGVGAAIQRCRQEIQTDKALRAIVNELSVRLRKNTSRK